MSETDLAPAPTTEDDRYAQAKRHVRKLREFYASLAAFVAVNLMLFLINLLTLSPGEGGGGWWFYWVTIFWGVGLLFQAIGVYGDRWGGRDWEDRKIQQYMDRA